MPVTVIKCTDQATSWVCFGFQVQKNRVYNGGEVKVGREREGERRGGREREGEGGRKGEEGRRGKKERRETERKVSYKLQGPHTQWHTSSNKALPVKGSITYPNSARQL